MKIERYTPDTEGETTGPELGHPTFFFSKLLSQDLKILSQDLKILSPDFDLGSRDLEIGCRDLKTGSQDPKIIILGSRGRK